MRSNGNATEEKEQIQRRTRASQGETARKKETIASFEGDLEVASTESFRQSGEPIGRPRDHACVATVLEKGGKWNNGTSYLPQAAQLPRQKMVVHSRKPKKREKRKEKT